MIPFPTPSGDETVNICCRLAERILADAGDGMVATFAKVSAAPA